ncbi:MAG: hypothetical protein HY917_03135 [Candidatus Diapherotrites archaeon]|nr:hypothetical protein [Candidatus Diapherotrites archaeon]
MEQTQLWKDVNLEDPQSQDINLTEGQGYLVFCTQANSFTLYGNLLSAPSLSEPNPYYQFISLPSIESHPTVHSAADYLQYLQEQGHSCPTISAFTGSQWKIHRQGLPLNNFSLESTQGYLLQCEPPADPQP